MKAALKSTPLKPAPIKFGQEAVKDLLIEKQGHATMHELVLLAEIRYPGTSIPRRVGEYLLRLRKWQEVDYRKGEWYLATEANTNLSRPVKI